MSTEIRLASRYSMLNGKKNYKNKKKNGRKHWSMSDILSLAPSLIVHWQTILNERFEYIPQSDFTAQPNANNLTSKKEEKKKVEVSDLIRKKTIQDMLRQNPCYYRMLNFLISRYLLTRECMNSHSLKCLAGLSGS